MPNDTPYKNLADAAQALKKGGRALAELTGEDEPDLPEVDVLREGFRRLTGAKKPERRFGGGED